MTEIRDARDGDSEGLIALIGSVFDEYPGVLLDVDGEMPELRAIGTWFRQHHGQFWIAEREGRVVGCVGWTPASEPEGLELRKLYVSKSERRSGLGSKLVVRVEAAAAARGARFIDLWSDTRFVTAHGFYQKRGYAKTGATRELHDQSDTVEYYFRKSLTR